MAAVCNGNVATARPYNTWVRMSENGRVEFKRGSLRDGFGGFDSFMDAMVFAYTWKLPAYS